jgi:hypothetical protein
MIFFDTANYNARNLPKHMKVFHNFFAKDFLLNHSFSASSSAWEKILSWFVRAVSVTCI